MERHRFLVVFVGAIDGKTALPTEPSRRLNKQRHRSGTANGPVDFSVLGWQLIRREF